MMAVGRAVQVRRSVVLAVIVLGVLGLLFVCYRGLYFSSPTITEDTIKISQLLSASIFLVEQAGKKVVAIRKGDDPALKTEMKGKTDEGVPDYYTLGDQQSHQIITDGLKSLWPQLLYRSEEKDRASHDSSLPKIPLVNKEISDSNELPVAVQDIGVWIDPLDATKEYTEGGKEPDLLKFVMVMVCVTVKGKPVAMVMHQPFAKANEGTTYWAWIDHGVSLSVKEGVDNKESTLNSLRYVVSRSHPGNAIMLIRRAFTGTSMSVSPVIAAGAGYKSLLVAQNRANLYFHSTRIKKWDVCPGNVLLETLGGRMTTRTGQSIDYSLESSPVIEEGIVATVNRDMHSRYMRRLRV